MPYSHTVLDDSNRSASALHRCLDIACIPKAPFCASSQPTKMAAAPAVEIKYRQLFINSESRALFGTGRVERRPATHVTGRRRTISIPILVLGSHSQLKRVMFPTSQPAFTAWFASERGMWGCVRVAL